jgi:hypothetical protein
MKKTMGLVFLVFVFITVSLGCAFLSAPFSPASTPLPPTDTPAPPTATIPAEPPTLTPTQTPAPNPDPPSGMAGFLTAIKVLSYDPLDNAGSWIWDSQTSSIHDGILEMSGKSDWASSVSLKTQIVEGTGVVLKFKLQKANAHSEFVFVTGDWQTGGFRQFGIYNDRRPKADLFQGTNAIGGNNLGGNLTLAGDTWYYIVMAVGKHGDFLAVIWDPNSESHHAVYHETLGDKWGGRSWNFMSKEDQGETLYIDECYRISFGEIK